MAAHMYSDKHGVPLKDLKTHMAEVAVKSASTGRVHSPVLLLMGSQSSTAPIRIAPAKLATAQRAGVRKILRRTPRRLPVLSTPMLDSLKK